MNVFLTSALIIPLRKSSFEKVRKLARNSVVATVAALVTSAANFITLSVQRGEQLSWVCLNSSGLDVSCLDAIRHSLATGARPACDDCDPPSEEASGHKTSAHSDEALKDI